MVLLKKVMAALHMTMHSPRLKNYFPPLVTKFRSPSWAKCLTVRIFSKFIIYSQLYSPIGLGQWQNSEVQNSHLAPHLTEARSGIITTIIIYVLYPVARAVFSGLGPE